MLKVDYMPISRFDGKLSLILDRTYVNQYLAKQTVKFEDWRVLLNYVSKNAFLYKFDLSSGYHHIDICKKTPGLLGFQLAPERQNKVFLLSGS